MAENENGQEKTEEATPKRLEKSREDGQVARSRELNTSAVLISGSVSLLVFGPGLALHMKQVAQNSFAFDVAMMLHSDLMLQKLLAALENVAWALLPIFAIVLAAALLAPSALGGFLFSWKAVAPKASKLNPLKGLKNMFSLKSLVELLKSIAKVALIGSVAFFMLRFWIDQLQAMRLESISAAIEHANFILSWTVLALALVTIAIVIIDVPYQIFEHKKQLKMTLQEVKDEMKDTDGKPEVKQRVRQLQYDMANKRMMENVPEADVVITNPEHFSVALKYDVENPNGAPLLVAKGGDQLAFKIREIAAAHEITIVPAPPLARAVYFTTEVDEEIPEGLYLAVAQVLAYVFQLKAYRDGKGSYRQAGQKKPQPPQNMPLDEQFVFDHNGKKGQ